MSANDDEPRFICGVCGLEIREKNLCYQIRAGIILQDRFEGGEVYMLVHSACLKE